MEHIDLTKLTKEQREERAQFLKEWAGEKGGTFYITCSGTVAPVPSSADGWETARENGEFSVEGAEIPKGY